ncbi:MAG: hypothetical protein PHW13_13790 [Methylococcales bacterium]|nr:hypothetical protein [Methylococcales bacterium]
MNLCKFTTFFLMMTLLIACGREQPPQISNQPAKTDKSPASLQGAVSNNSGPVKHGKIEARTASGDLLAETTLENSARYLLTIPAGTVLPVILNYIPDGRAADGEKMQTVAVQPGISRYDINPLTTAIARQAKALGGYSLRNMVQAAEDGVHVPDANKTSTGFRGDPTTQYGGWH